MKMKPVLLFVVLSAIVFSGCSKSEQTEAAQTGTYVPNQREAAYAYTHGGYVGKAEVIVDAEGNLDVSIDEAFLPHTLAVVEIGSGGWNESNTISYMSRGSSVYVAKYVEYNDITYVAVPVGAGFVYVAADDAGNPVGSIDFEKEILRNQATMAAYYALISAGRFHLLPQFGGDPIPVTTTTYGGVTKKNSPGYWNSGIGWRGNVEAIEVFIEENGGQFSLSSMVRASTANSDGLKLWSVADAVTSATNTDFKDYFGVVQTALGRLKTN